MRPFESEDGSFKISEKDSQFLQDKKCFWYAKDLQLKKKNPVLQI